MQLSTMKCPACGASVSVQEGETQFQCEYCKNSISIIKPVAIENKFIEGLSEMQKQQFDNYVSILQQSMLAGNYGEAYNYCNKALEVNPKAGGIWENKAICAFWLSHVRQFEEDKAIEIVTYLNASKQSDPNSPTYEQTCKDLASNLYNVISYLYISLQYDNVVQTQGGVLTTRGYKTETLRTMLSYMRLTETCYQIYPDLQYLKAFVHTITNGRGIKWIEKYTHTPDFVNTQTAMHLNFDAATKRKQLIDKIKSIEPDYIAPGSEPYVKKKNTQATVIAIISIALFIFFVIICAIAGRN